MRTPHGILILMIVPLCRKANGTEITPNSKVHGANVGSTWGQQDPGGPHVGPMNHTVWDSMDNSRKPCALHGPWCPMSQKGH